MDTVAYSSAIQNEIFPFAEAQMDLEGIMLSEVRQRKRNTIRYYSYVESKKYHKLVNIAKINGLTDMENKLVVTSGVREGEGQDRDRGLRGTYCYV